MSPSRVEFLHPATEEWVLIAEVHPGQPGGSFSHNKTDGSREIYKIDCAPDDSETIISKSSFGMDMNTGEGGREIFSAGFVNIARLKEGEVFEMDIKPDRIPVPMSMRVTHIAPQT